MTETTVLAPTKTSRTMMSSMKTMTSLLTWSQSLLTAKSHHRSEKITKSKPTLSSQQLPNNRYNLRPTLSRSQSRISFHHPPLHLHSPDSTTTKTSKHNRTTKGRGLRSLKMLKKEQTKRTPLAKMGVRRTRRGRRGALAHARNIIKSIKMDLKSYKIATINMNAVTNDTKLNALNTFIRASELDVIFLQEVAVTSLSIPGFSVEYNIDERRRGTAIAVKNYFKYTNVRKSHDSRIISMNINDVTLINVYAPPGTQNRGAREQFFNSSLSQFYYDASRTVIVGGDFNCVIQQKDATGTNSHSPMLQRFVKAAGVLDSWEVLHGNRVEFSFIRADSSSRIDRILVSANTKSWLRTAYFVPTAFSDHKAYIIRTVLPTLGTPSGRGIWRMQTSILDDPGVMQELANKWIYWTRFRRNYASWIQWWIDYVKPKLTSFLKWKTSLHRKTFNDTMELYYAMLRNAYDEYYTNPQQLQHINHIKALMLTLERKENMKRRAWNEVFIGGESTSIFQIAEQKKRRSQTTITKLNTEAGELADQGAIQQHVRQYFEELYSSSAVEENDTFAPAKRIPDDNEHNRQIMQEIEEDEILTAIKASASHKSPGADGLPKEFFIKSWQIIKREFTLVMNDALAGRAPAVFTDGIIVLVRKKNGGNNIKGFRPISLLNYDYKTLARIIKERMAKLLPLVLSTKQKCCNGQSNIFEATSRILDKTCELKEGRQNALLVAFDFDHAFDRVEYSFLARTMERMNFNRGLINLIMQLGRYSQSRVLVNGIASHPIDIQRSVRQGDPLAMLLYVIYIQPLLDKLAELHPQAVLNAYADDISMFISTEQQLRTVADTFSDFQRASGATLNTRKTSALMIGMVNLTEETEWLNVESKIKILGIYFLENFRDTVEENWSKVFHGFQASLWVNNARNLNVIQKVILINTYISSKIWYTASVLPLPNKYSGKFISKIGTFLWYGKPWTRIAFETMILPKARGGLNLHSPAIKAKALLVNRVMQFATELPFLWSYIEHNANPPFVQAVPRRYEHIRTIVLETASLPEQISRNPTSASIYQLLLERLKNPKIIRENPDRDWKQVFKNIHNRKLSSQQRSTWYAVIHRKVLTNQLLFNRNQTDNPNCTICPGEIDTLEHHLFLCRNMRPIWHFQRNQLISLNINLSRIELENWIYPAFSRMNRNHKLLLLKTFSTLLCYLTDPSIDSYSIRSYLFYKSIM